jgi:NAD(P)-dependent dehydrogenase (short-subunit alcohol dehydrogenase family)
MSLAVVLGGGRGFGLEAARALGKAGHSVLLTDIDPEHLELGARSLRADGITCRAEVADSRDGRALRRLADSVAAGDHVGVLVSVVGGSLGTPRWVADVRPEDTARVMSLSVGSPLNALTAFRPRLAQGSSVVLISSSAARLGDRHGWSPAYAFAKGAVLGMARFLACDPGWSGIRVTAVCPGDVETERTGEIHSSGIISAEEVETVRKFRNALGRMATAEEMGSSIAELAMNTFASGAILDVNGGEWPTPA